MHATRSKLQYLSAFSKFTDSPGALLLAACARLARLFYVHLLNALTVLNLCAAIPQSPARGKCITLCCTSPLIVSAWRKAATSLIVPY